MSRSADVKDERPHADTRRADIFACAHSPFARDCLRSSGMQR